jgi:predicted RND superfamily exporter protein
VLDGSLTVLELFKSAWDWAMKGLSLYKELKQERDVRHDEEKLPQVVRWMDEIEQKVRTQENIHSYSPVFDDEEWWTKALPSISRKLIREAMAKRQEKKRKIDEQWQNR